MAKFHLVKPVPLTHDDFAIKNLRNFNEALLGKRLWQFGGERDAI